jgi:hypothetical protein
LIKSEKLFTKCIFWAIKKREFGTEKPFEIKEIHCHDRFVGPTGINGQKILAILMTLIINLPSGNFLQNEAKWTNSLSEISSFKWPLSPQNQPLSNHSKSLYFLKTKSAKNPMNHTQITHQFPTR